MTTECQCAEAAYAAGLFDGEGCISVSPYTTAEERGRFHCDVYLGMQSLAGLELFQRVVGVGKITRRVDLWMFQASGSKAADVLQTLLPYLRVKREAARLFLEFAATFSARNRKPLPADILAIRHDLSRRIREIAKADSLFFRLVGEEANPEPNRGVV